MLITLCFSIALAATLLTNDGVLLGDSVEQVFAGGADDLLSRSVVSLVVHSVPLSTEWFFFTTE